MGFDRVKTILQDAITAWKNENGEPPDLTVHGTHFPALDGDFTLDDLKNGIAKGRPLIQPDVIGQNPPRGSEANLVKILRGSLPPPPAPAPQMPFGGPFISSGLVDEIQDWIDAGCLPEGPVKPQS
jgi:hypothetical protein